MDDLFYRTALQSYLRHVGRAPTTMEQIEITKRRSKLLTRIMDHQRKAHQYLRTGTANDDDYTYSPSEVFVVGADGELNLVSNRSDPFTAVQVGPQPECFQITLPSGISRVLCWERGLENAIKLEIQLRVGQCNDSLKGI